MCDWGASPAPPVTACRQVHLTVEEGSEGGEGNDGQLMTAARRGPLTIDVSCGMPKTSDTSVSIPFCFGFGHKLRGFET